jgi:hypothetical protein
MKRKEILSILNRYRIEKRMTMSAFAKQIGLSLEVTRNALLNICTPHDYNMIAFERYYTTHKQEIYNTIGDTAPCECSQ